MKRKKIYGIFMLVAIAVFLFAGGRILQIYLNYQESQKVYKQMEGFTQKIEDQDLSPEAVPGETTGEVVEQGFLQVDFNKLEEINPDVIAWIEIPGPADPSVSTLASLIYIYAGFLSVLPL